jgi:hypothetical protein
MKWKNFAKVGSFSFLIVGLAILAGCSTANTSNPPRTVTEQLLLSTAADRAVDSVSGSLEIFRHKKIFLDGSYYDSYDPKYVLGSIRDALSRAGGKLMPSATNSEIIIEARCGGLSIDPSSSLVGIAQTGLPIPLAGTLSIPELSVYKAERQHAIAKLALLAYTTDEREHVYSSGPMVGKSYNKNYKILGLIRWTTTDIPEKKRKPRE